MNDLLTIPVPLDLVLWALAGPLLLVMHDRHVRLQRHGEPIAEPSTVWRIPPYRGRGYSLISCPWVGLERNGTVTEQRGLER